MDMTPLPAPQPIPAAPAAAIKTSSLAIWSMVLGICAFVLCMGPLTAVPAIICGHMALSRIGSSQGKLGGHGMAVTGLVTGYIATVLSVLIVPLVFAMAIPAVHSAREAAMDSMRLAQARMLAMSCITYAAQNDGMAPEYLGQLVDAGIIDDDAMDSLGDLGTQPDAFEVAFRGNLNQCKSPETTVLLLGPVSDDGKRRVVAYADGHVEMQSAEEYLP